MLQNAGFGTGGVVANREPGSYIAFVNMCMHHVSTQHVYVNISEYIHINYIYSKPAVEVGWIIFLFSKPHLLCITVDFEFSSGTLLSLEICSSDVYFGTFNCSSWSVGKWHVYGTGWYSWTTGAGPWNHVVADRLVPNHITEKLWPIFFAFQPRLFISCRKSYVLFDVDIQQFHWWNLFFVQWTMEPWR